LARMIDLPGKNVGGPDAAGARGAEDPRAEGHFPRASRVHRRLKKAKKVRVAGARAESNSPGWLAQSPPPPVPTQATQLPGCMACMARTHN